MSSDSNPWMRAMLADFRPAARSRSPPIADNVPHELYFMCDGPEVGVASLAKKGVRFSKVQEARWGSTTQMRLPGGGRVGLYQPKHPTALGLGLK